MRALMRTHVYSMQLMCVGFEMHVIVCVRVLQRFALLSVRKIKYCCYDLYY